MCEYKPRHPAWSQDRVPGGRRLHRVPAPVAPPSPDLRHPFAPSNLWLHSSLLILLITYYYSACPTPRQRSVEKYPKYSPSTFIFSLIHRPETLCYTSYQKHNHATWERNSQTRCQISSRENDPTRPTPSPCSMSLKRISL